MTLVTNSQNPTTKVAFYTLTEGNSLTIIEDMHVMGITWVAQASAVLTISSDTSVPSLLPSQTTLSAQQFGSFASKNSLSPIDGITFSVTGGSVSFMFLI